MPVRTRKRGNPGPGRRRGVKAAGACDGSGRQGAGNDYNRPMIDEAGFRQHFDQAFQSLKQALIASEESSDFEVEDQGGALHVSFPDGSRFVISPNAPVRQIWISARSTSFKLDWSDDAQDFVLQKTGEGLRSLVARLANEQLGDESVRLD